MREVKDFKALKKLEESLWKDETRFDLAYMEQILTPDFFEFGRSGRIYTREDTLAVPTQKTKAVLTQFKAHVVDTHTVLVTYVSEVLFYEDGEIEKANRSSLWLKTSKGWQIRFHQGTPIRT